jgi:hypothetical protein
MKVLSYLSLIASVSAINLRDPAKSIAEQDKSLKELLGREEF